MVIVRNAFFKCLSLGRAAIVLQGVTTVLLGEFCREKEGLGLEAETWKNKKQTMMIWGGGGEEGRGAGGGGAGTGGTGEGRRPVLSCSVGGAPPQQFSSQVSPRTHYVVILNISGVTSFRENPMKAVGLLSRSVHTHNSRGPGVPGLPPALCTTPRL